MKVRRLSLALSIIAVLLAHGAIPIVVPNESATQEGNDYSTRPFGSINMHYQQVYDASQFAALSTRGAFVRLIEFRFDCVQQVGGASYTNVQVNLSTTAKGPDQLSSVFAENVGTNDNRVFGPGRFSNFGGGDGCPDIWDGIHYLRLDTPFFYNPAEGNLLMEVRLDGVRVSPGGFANDAVNTTNDSVSRAFAFSSDATIATQVDTIGLVTLFVFDPIPSLTNSLTTNAVVITWPTQPTTFVLQRSDGLWGNTNWQLYTNGIVGNQLYQTLTIPRQDLTSSVYFRLAWPDGPAIPQSSGSTNGPPP
jgi:hypothetical protein